MSIIYRHARTTSWWSVASDDYSVEKWRDFSSLSLPVKRTLSHLSSMSCSPTSGPPKTTFTALGSRYLGMLAARNAAVYGASSDGFTTTALPAASAPESGSRAKPALQYIATPTWGKYPFPQTGDMIRNWSCKTCTQERDTNTTCFDYIHWHSVKTIRLSMSKHQSGENVVHVCWWHGLASHICS